MGTSALSPKGELWSNLSQLRVRERAAVRAGMAAVPLAAAPLASVPDALQTRRRSSAASQ